MILFSIILIFQIIEMMLVSDKLYGENGEWLYVQFIFLRKVKRMIYSRSLWWMGCSVFVMRAELNMWNATGKTTILKILGGKHMVEPHMIRVLGRSAFHDTTLTTSGDLCYLGGEVRHLSFTFQFNLIYFMSLTPGKYFYFGR